MNEADFIQEMMKQANLSEDQGGMVNEIFQSNFIGGDYTIGAGLLATGVLNKIMGIFKRK